MIEVAAALSAATTAFNAIKKGFEVGRDIEGMAGDLGRWMGSVSDIDKAGEYAKNPPLFKKLFASGSVETAIYAQKEKQRKVIEISAIAFAVVFGGGFIIWVTAALLKSQGVI